MVVAFRDMGRPKKYDYPDYMTFDSANGYFTVRNPESGKSKTFTLNEEAEARAAAKAVGDWVDNERQRRAIEAGRPTLSGLVLKWQEDRLPFMPWAASTSANNVAKMRRIKRELGKRTVVSLDCMFIEEWIASFCNTADTFNDWRYIFVLLLKFAVSRKMVQVNEAEKIEERSTSKKIEVNRKARQPLDLEGFRAIHTNAAPWLQLAMEESLITLQGRSEICNMRLTDHRDGFLYVIRDKTSADSDMAFIKIKITEQIEEFCRRSRKLDNTVSPFVIHRKPTRQQRRWVEGKAHWTAITPDYLTKGFAAARDQLPRFAGMSEAERPSFHEVRGLGARIYRERGMNETAIQALMTHAHQRTTQIYLDRGAAALTDDDYQPVEAPLVLRDVFGG